MDKTFQFPSRFPNTRRFTILSTAIQDYSCRVPAESATKPVSTTLLGPNERNRWKPESIDPESVGGVAGKKSTATGFLFRETEQFGWQANFVEVRQKAGRPVDGALIAV